MATCPNVESTVYKTSRGKSSAGLQAVDETPAVIELLDERYFVRMLRLERKRCERSHEPFALMLFEAPELFEWAPSVLLLELHGQFRRAPEKLTSSAGMSKAESLG